MRSSPLLITLCLALGFSEARRQGSNPGSSHDDDDNGNDNNDDDGSSAADSMWNPGDTGDSNRAAPCGWYARQEAYGLPGLYYNGTLKVQHRVMGNTACGGDRASETYEYPALMLIAPTGNETDTNPMHWVLRGFQPQQNYSTAAKGILDLHQRSTYIRSSDFVIDRDTSAWPSPFTPFYIDKYADADATALGSATDVYWKTAITSHDDDVLNATAQYTRKPPVLDADDYDGAPAGWSPGLYSSQFVTLSDVCASDQDVAKSRRVDDGDTVTPTLWLSEGATAEMTNIGATSMTWSLDQTLEEVVPWINRRKPGCSPEEATPFELSDFYPLQSDDASGSGIRPWNISVSIGLSFEGSLVRDNSTSLKGYTGGKVEFAADYTAVDDDDDGGSRAAGMTMWPCSLVAAVVLGVVMMQ
ncbi:Fatty acid hydroxylase superfamily [Geosmithia morbida]|uniref:Fatty acid hydroxylase superfamily n=1 Tax=Geosmithia morbida TaxID=1094350 RepID=A0A9P4Z0W0_9HYPO|nr:Fatty acid hydroxylase superfamily [Geosmithia morbida]KAF4126653.1 Fatty acid hydroxylase superfamily [Geosmithia morbida]